MEKIIVRNKIMLRGYINSAFIRLRKGVAYNAEQLMNKFSIEEIMKEVYQEEIVTSQIEKSSLYESYILAKNQGKDNDDFIILNKVDNEFAIHLTGNIYLHHLSSDDYRCSIVPWTYSDSKKYIGDTWWFSDDDIIGDLKTLSILDFFRRYKGY